MSQLLLNSRRFSIVLILSLGFFYFYLTRDSDALAPIGLISFSGVAQFLPAIIAALFWREASLKAATAAVAVGFVVWAWSSFMPSFESVSPLVATHDGGGAVGLSLAAAARRCSGSTGSTRWSTPCSGACSSTRRRWSWSRC